MGFPNYLRTQNIFDPANQQGMPPIDLANPTPPPNPMGMPYQNMDLGGSAPLDNPGPQPELPPAPPNFDPMASYHPETQASDAYNQLMSQYPTQAPVSGGRRIGASLLGALTDLGTNLGGPQHAAGARTGPRGMDVFNEMTGRNDYLEAVKDWQNKIGPAGTAAANERASNANERTLAYQRGQQELGARKLDETERKNKEQAGFTQAKLDADEWKRQHPAHKFTMGKDGNLYATDPVTLEKTNLGKTGMSETELAILNNKYKVEQIHAGGVEDRATKEVPAPKGWMPVNIPDPNDPTKTIAARMNLDSGQTLPITMDGKGITAIAKPGTTLPGGNTQLKGIQDKARETIAEINNLIDDNGKLKDNIKMAVGKSRYLGAQFVYGSETRAADAAINRVKNENIINLIGEMKAQSKTGATGFGQLSARELDVLEKAASKLDPTLDEETFQTELKRIRDKFQMILQPTNGLEPTTTAKPPLTTAPPPPIPNTHYEKQPDGTWKLFHDK